MESFGILVQPESALEGLRWAIDESLADPRPNIPANEVFRDLRAYHARRVRGEEK